MTYVYINGFSCVLQFPPFLVFVDLSELELELVLDICREWREEKSTPFPSLIKFYIVENRK